MRSAAPARHHARRGVIVGALILLIAFSPIPAAADPEDATGFAENTRRLAELVLRHADHLYESGDSVAAVTEYKRYLFLSPPGESSADAYHGIALALREQYQWDASLIAFDLSLRTTTSDEKIWQRQIDSIATMIAAGRYAGAEYQLARLAALAGNAPDSQAKMQTLDHYLAILQVLQYHWEDAAIVVSRMTERDQSSGHGSSVDWLRLIALIEEAQAAPRKSPTTARGLSVLLPGAGQVYAGAVASGVGALAINAAGVGLLTYTLLNGYYLESALLFLYVVTRFYSGNLYNAESAALEWNRRSDEEYAGEILELLSVNQ